MSDYGSLPAVRAFERELDELIERHWPNIGPSYANGTVDLEDDPDTPMVVSSWVLVLGASPLDPDASDVHSSTRFARPRQSPHTGIGLLTDALAIWVG